MPEALDELRLPAEPEDRAVPSRGDGAAGKVPAGRGAALLEGYSFSEIAGLLRLTPSAVSMRLHRARKMLREQLGRDQYRKKISSALQMLSACRRAAGRASARRLPPTGKNRRLLL